MSRIVCSRSSATGQAPQAGRSRRRRQPLTRRCGRSPRVALQHVPLRGTAACQGPKENAAQMHSPVRRVACWLGGSDGWPAADRSPPGKPGVVVCHGIYVRKSRLQGPEGGGGEFVTRVDVARAASGSVHPSEPRRLTRPVAQHQLDHPLLVSADQNRVGRHGGGTRNVLRTLDLNVLFRARRFSTRFGNIETSTESDNTAQDLLETQPRARPGAPFTTVALAGRAATPRRTDFSKNGRANVASAAPTRV